MASQVAPGDLLRALPRSAPEQGEPFDRILADFRELVVPGVTHWGHPGWFAYFPSNSSPPSVLGELLAAGLGVQGMSWATSPAATELEQVVMEWYRRLLALPDGFTGVIQDTASTCDAGGLPDGPGPCREPIPRGWWPTGRRRRNSSVGKAARLAGFIPLGHRRVVPVDHRLRHAARGALRR